MTIRKILTEPDPFLRQVSKNVEKVDKNLRKLMDDMLETMYSAPGIGYTDIENSQIRKVIADRLTFSKQNIPHYYVTVTVEMDNLMKLRAKLNKVASQKLSVNVFVMKAAALAALQVPATNSSWMEDFVR